MKIFMSLAICSSALFACTSDDSTSEARQDERIELHGCDPRMIEVGDQCYDPWPSGSPGPGHTWRDEQGDSPLPGWGGGGGGGGGDPVPTMDPEPDRFKNRKSCWDWCNWNRRQCEKECRHLYPDPHFNERNRCIKSCDTSKDPNKGLNACTADCNARFPERPIITVAP